MLSREVRADGGLSGADVLFLPWGRGARCSQDSRERLECSSESSRGPWGCSWGPASSSLQPRVFPQPRNVLMEDSGGPWGLLGVSAMTLGLAEGMQVD